MKSCRSSASSMPSAEKCDGNSGTITVGICSSRAIAQHVQRPRAARGHQREVARIVALRHRHLAHRQRHLGDGDLDDRLRRRDRVELQRIGDLLLDAAPRRLGIELHLSAEEIVRIEPPEHHVGVGDGRLACRRRDSRSDRDRRRRSAVRPSARRRRRARRCCRRRRRPRPRRSSAASPDGRWHSRRRSSPAPWSARRRAPGSPWRWCRPCRRR